MKPRHRTRRPVLRGVALLALVAAAAVALAAFAAPATAAASSKSASPKARTASPTPTVTPVASSNSLVKVGQDATLPAGQTVDSVVAVGGDANIYGHVSKTVVAVGGDIHLYPGSTVGVVGGSYQASLVSVGGHITVDQGAGLMGKVNQVSVSLPHLSGVGSVARGILRPVGSIVGWVAGTLFSVLLALVVAVLFPRQLSVASDRLRAQPLASLGWGAVAVIASIGVLVLLLITIIGIVVMIPLLVILFFVALFNCVVAATTIGRFIVEKTGWSHRTLTAWAVLGALVLSVVQAIPFIGGFVVLLVAMAAYGATAWVFMEWRRARRAAQPAPAGAGPAGPVPPAPPYAAGYAVPPIPAPAAPQPAAPVVPEAAAPPAPPSPPAPPAPPAEPSPPAGPDGPGS